MSETCLYGPFGVRIFFFRGRKNSENIGLLEKYNKKTSSKYISFKFLGKFILKTWFYKKNKTDVTVNAYIGSFLFSAHFYNKQLNTTRYVEIISIFFLQNLWKFDEE